MSADPFDDTVTVVIPRKLQIKLIQLYKSFPCLWDKNCVSYKSKKKRHDAVTKLTELVQEYDTSATRVHVLRKIESLRACVRREFKKVQKNRLTATDEDEVYKPHLWYYDMMSFIIQDKEMPDCSFKEQASTEVMSESESEEVEDEKGFETHTDDFAQENIMFEVPESTSSGKRFNYEDDRSKRHCTEIEDEYDAIGINVAAKLRSLPAHMRILAEKLINDVLFEAQTNNLTPATAVITPADPFK